MAEHFTDTVDFNKESKKPRVKIEYKFLNMFTLEQLDMWNTSVKKAHEGSSAWSEINFITVYISKYFSNELSFET